jgi:hypothetical protein
MYSIYDMYKMSIRLLNINPLYLKSALDSNKNIRLLQIQYDSNMIWTAISNGNNRVFINNAENKKEVDRVIL